MKALVIITAIIALVGIVYGTDVGINIASADEQVVENIENPTNAYPTIYGTSIVAENYYVLLNNTGTPGNYDISYDGNTCMRWLRDDMPVVIANPRIITYTTPVDDFDLISIIACEA